MCQMLSIPRDMNITGFACLATAILSNLGTWKMAGIIPFRKDLGTELVSYCCYSKLPHV